jgi:hypothetical protein
MLPDDTFQKVSEIMNRWQQMLCTKFECKYYKPRGTVCAVVHWSIKTYDRLCGIVVRVPGYRMEMYCASCEVQTEFIYVM